MKGNIIFLSLVLFVAFTVKLNAQPNDAGVNLGKTEVFIKKELNSGLYLTRQNDHESLNTDFSEYDEDMTSYNGYYRMVSNYWRFLANMQEQVSFLGGIGPLYSHGESTRFNSAITTHFKNKIYGLSFLGEANYLGRYYYDGKRYALVEARAYGKLEKLWINSEGASYPSDACYNDATSVEYNSVDNRFRYGVDARGGVGFGKAIAMNHKMLAEFLMDEYYKGKLFSPDEIERFSSVIASIKNKRKMAFGHSSEKELKEVTGFLNKEMLLQIPEVLGNFWMVSEFEPRLSGKRFEIGPLFNYYNREPDFIYGGFARFANYKYIDYKRNVNFSSELSYNHYKKSGWFLWENTIQFDFYCKLKTKYSFGAKYNPSIVMYKFKEFEKPQHSFTPFVKIYHQINSKQRVSLAINYNFTGGQNEFYIKGPEFSLAWYRSKY